MSWRDAHTIWVHEHHYYVADRDDVPDPPSVGQDGHSIASVGPGCVLVMTGTDTGPVRLVVERLDQPPPTAQRTARTGW